MKHPDSMTFERTSDEAMYSLAYYSEVASRMLSEYHLLRAHGEYAGATWRAYETAEWFRGFWQQAYTDPFNVKYIDRVRHNRRVLGTDKL
jgi:hypothetical protein